MNTIDDLRDALRSLERLAPDQLPDSGGRWESLSSEGTRGRRSRAGLLAAAASVAAVVAVALTVVLPTKHHSTQQSSTPLPAARATPTTLAALDCPAKLGSPASTWVPTAAHGVDSTTRLTPSATPRQLVIC